MADDTDIFAPPEGDEHARKRPNLCKDAGPAGERCYLYLDHASEYHWDGYRRWTAEGYLAKERR